ncbi:DUF819 family protein [Spirosoma knui]
MEPLITHDAIILGILLVLLALIFQTAKSPNPFWQKFYTVVPALLLCYIFPALLNSFNLVSGEDSKLYTVASQYLLPAALVMLTSTADLRSIWKLGSKALIVFLAGTFGVIIGGPIALWVVEQCSDNFHQQAIDQQYWKGLVTLSGSWIGGSSSQLVLKEIYGSSESLFTIVLVIDAVVANTWTACLIYGAAFTTRIDSFLKADTSSIEDVKQRVKAYHQQIDKPATLSDITSILALGFGGAAVAHAAAAGIVSFLTRYQSFLEANGLQPFLSNFLWIVLVSTTLGILLSFTRVRNFEKLGTTDFATLFIYFLIMTIGMRLDVTALSGNIGLLFVAIIWMLIHVLIMFVAARAIRAPYFFVAVGSQANIGGVATAPAVASVFHPSLAPVGVLLAVLSHVLGTYGGIACGWLMQLIE